MRSKFWAALLSAIVVLTFLNSCDKKGGDGCVLSRSVYSRGTAIALAFINKDSLNLLTAKALQTKDIEIKYGNTAVDTLPLYSDTDPTSLKYIAFFNFGSVGSNNLTISVKGTPHILSFNQKLVSGSCAGPNFDLSDFKLDDKTTEPVSVSETLSIMGNKANATFSKIYIII